MPNGGLMQLVAYGAQDMYLTGNPAITFFDAGYRRHTNFSENDYIDIPRDVKKQHSELCLVDHYTLDRIYEEDCCAICLDEFKVKDEVHQTLCNHIFHFKCMSKLINSNHQCTYRCPLCRKEMYIYEEI